MIFAVQVYQQVYKGKTMKITHCRPFIQSDKETDEEMKAALAHQPAYLGNGVLTKNIPVAGGAVRQVNEPFNFPIKAENIQEAFTKFEEAGQEHLAVLQKKELSRIITDLGAK